MDRLPGGVTISRVSDGSEVSAPIVELTRDLAKRQIDAKWWAIPDVSKRKREKENDHQWNWTKSVGVIRNSRWHEAIAIQTTDSEVQGAMIYRTDARSLINPDFGTIAVEALATAPRNRPWLVDDPKFRGVGEGLLLRAVCH